MNVLSGGRWYEMKKGIWSSRSGGCQLKVIYHLESNGQSSNIFSHGNAQNCARINIENHIGVRHFPIVESGLHERA